MLWATGVNWASTIMLFDYRAASAASGTPWVFIVPYLVGSIVFVNATLICTVFSNSIMSKIAWIDEIEPIQSWVR